MTLPAPPAPFILLDDARIAGAAEARLYRDPVEIVTADRPEAVAGALAALCAGTARGLHAAGFLSYEAGHALEPRLAPLAAPGALPLLWFGLFEGFTAIAPDAVPAWLPDPAGAWAGQPRPGIDRADYGAAIRAVLDAIAAGDIYQANLTFRSAVAVAGAPAALYAGLRARARAGYGALISTGRDWLLSLSPELFFSLRDGQLSTKPMKGTATRGKDDAAAVSRLREDPKQRAENLMIVDLLRNDLSRIAVPGSVAVPELFTVETYPTVHQMISRVTAQIAPGRDAVDALCALFPCGSITGAPKIRATEIIAQVEPDRRGIYTGAIGRLDPGGDAAFNVAIRTLHLPMGETVATIGLGSGIVADSKEEDEWRECLAKGKFVASSPPEFDLIETMAFDPIEGLLLLDRHLARMGASAARFDFRFDRHEARNELQAATFRLRAPSRVRLLASRGGHFAIEVRPAPERPDMPVSVALAPLPVAPGDFRLAHKTTDRAFYDRARHAAGTFEVAFVAPDGGLNEGSFTNIFVERDGRLLTPPLSRGLLPGILRAELIASGRAVEAELTAADLGEAFLVGNAVRGLLPARLVQL
ncbi:aminodeoxychorismate synthase component I [Sphingomonas sp. SCN 67-18]|uniref:aminodeoxychorismate synthase component I n=1 Tax=uncultured Sphingomonas sp. TaxID=158754 RepID=UPI000ACC187E|nr:aminodeoxychorismate synthase component I [Sphingomonas sp. SCN 67-18]